MDESREKRDFNQVSTDRPSSQTARRSTWIPAMSWSNIVVILSIIILLVATLITDLIRHIFKPCLIWIILDSWPHVTSCDLQINNKQIKRDNLLLCPTVIIHCPAFPSSNGPLESGVVINCNFVCNIIISRIVINIFPVGDHQQEHQKSVRIWFTGIITHRLTVWCHRVRTGDWPELGLPWRIGTISNNKTSPSFSPAWVPPLKTMWLHF